MCTLHWRPKYTKSGNLLMESTNTRLTENNCKFCYGQKTPLSSLGVQHSLHENVKKKIQHIKLNQTSDHLSASNWYDQRCTLSQWHACPLCVLVCVCVHSQSFSWVTGDWHLLPQHECGNWWKLLPSTTDSQLGCHWPHFLESSCVLLHIQNSYYEHNCGDKTVYFITVILNYCAKAPLYFSSDIHL